MKYLCIVMENMTIKGFLYTIYYLTNFILIAALVACERIDKPPCWPTLKKDATLKIYPSE